MVRCRRCLENGTNSAIRASGTVQNLLRVRAVSALAHVAGCKLVLGFLHAFAGESTRALSAVRLSCTLPQRQSLATLHQDALSVAGPEASLLYSADHYHPK